ncbi:MAG: zinc ribbon domain-containing protein [Thermoplasmata archaeon]|jgi:putative transposase
MMQKHNVAKNIVDNSFDRFKQKLKWKAEKYGKNIISIGKFDPSSKLCSRCGNIKQYL